MIITILTRMIKIAKGNNLILYSLKLLFVKLVVSNMTSIYVKEKMFNMDVIVEIAFFN